VLAFFILLNAYSTYDEIRTKQAIESINTQFLGIYEKTRALFKMFEDQQQDVQVAEGSQTFPGDDLLFRIIQDHYDEYQALGKYVSEYGMGGRVGIMVTTRGLVITVSNDLTFDSGSSVLTPAGQGFLDRLIPILVPFRNDVLIEGHTDAAVPATAGYRSNWELSQARAFAVLRYLNQGGIDIERLSAAGCGQFRPIADNSTPENRALNRRVDIIIKHPNLQLDES
jgi:chemotaxis protein MotB